MDVMDSLLGSDRELLESLQAISKSLVGIRSDLSGKVEESWGEFRAHAEALNNAGPVEEFRFSLPSARSQVLFCALLKRCGVKAYRYRGQKRSTINARVSKRFVDELLWPQYREFASILDTFFDGLAFQVISDTIGPGPFQVEVRRKPTAKDQLCPISPAQLVEDRQSDK
jgi:hypothetical protein